MEHIIPVLAIPRCYMYLSQIAFLDLDLPFLGGLVSLTFLIWMHFLFDDWKPPIKSAQRDKKSTCVSNKCVFDFKSHQILAEWFSASKEALLFKQSFSQMRLKALLSTLVWPNCAMRKLFISFNTQYRDLAFQSYSCLQCIVAQNASFSLHFVQNL